MMFAKYSGRLGLRQSTAHSQGGSTIAFVCRGATCRALSSIVSFRPVLVTIFCEPQLMHDRECANLWNVICCY